MKSRGEIKFGRLSGIGAKNYERLMGGVATGVHYDCFVKDLAGLVPAGRLLDIGTGPGRMLGELRDIAPGLELFGLDVSRAMIDLARRNLANASVNLRVGSIASTEFEDGFFDAATCTKSFYLWDEPERCLAELHRILKPGGKAYLYESTRDYDRSEVEAVVKEGLAQESLLIRFFARSALRKQLAETYSNAEFMALAANSPFGKACAIDRMPVRLPIWVRVTLTKALS